MNILISSCLLGNPVRFDGKSKSYDISSLNVYNLIPVCPEVEGGLTTPRPPSEVQKDGRILNIEGVDVSENFQKGASIALDLCMQFDVKVAILKSKSPSCSNNLIYDGSFSKSLKKGKGITAKLLELHGIKVYNENEILEAVSYINKNY